MIESFRDLLITSIDMDLIERNTETGKCDYDLLELVKYKFYEFWDKNWVSEIFKMIIL